MTIKITVQKFIKLITSGNRKEYRRQWKGFKEYCKKLDLGNPRKQVLKYLTFNESKNNGRDYDELYPKNNFTDST
mgnify:FL=1